jgi:osmotically-inducible protein OsmY
MKLLLRTVSIAMSISALVTLTGCIGGSGSGFAGDNRTLPTINEDHDAGYQANNRLSASKELVGRTRISAIVFNHEMLLVGQALSESSKMKAEELVKSTPGITKVYNQITIKEPSGALATISDSTLTSNIKTRLLATKDLKSSQFKVVSEDGVVYLMGLTSREQAEKAIKIIQDSSGVKRVVTLVRYLN